MYTNKILLQRGGRKNNKKILNHKEILQQNLFFEINKKEKN